MRFAYLETEQYDRYSDPHLQFGSDHTKSKHLRQRNTCAFGVPNTYARQYAPYIRCENSLDRFMWSCKKLPVLWKARRLDSSPIEVKHIRSTRPGTINKGRQATFAACAAALLDNDCKLNRLPLLLSQYSLDICFSVIDHPVLYSTLCDAEIIFLRFCTAMSRTTRVCTSTRRRYLCVCSTFMHYRLPSSWLVFRYCYWAQFVRFDYVLYHRYCSVGDRLSSTNSVPRPSHGNTKT